ncbi:uncharacterized protein LAESUDRAFT_727428 [Laetiporus sulphureus 93-53]|uniref:Uncharacterized protein n=1 Tax=Laetiporus sulphureus 93-53 TaxID=1314785 RepID=A0A165DH10_9APHY|nr:uncharacterized protein LAESUDRAFT_727428 [Laetiporus sulphureus 93-53]KZT04859.1 hypothetical protein LAESUDRAFT_727428 [Laetiporus sulphureus 93-53]
MSAWVRPTEIKPYPGIWNPAMVAGSCTDRLYAGLDVKTGTAKLRVLCHSDQPCTTSSR